MANPENINSFVNNFDSQNIQPDPATNCFKNCERPNPKQCVSENPNSEDNIDSASAVNCVSDELLSTENNFESTHLYAVVSKKNS